MSSRRTDCVVVGGGIIGALIARSLAGDGLHVTLVERSKLGREASYEAAGMLAPLGECEAAGPFLDLCLESRDMFGALAADLFSEVGAEVRYRTEGTLQLAFNDDEANRLKDRAALHASLEIPSELLDPTAARQLEPAITPSLVAALSIPGDHQIDNRRFIEAVALSCFARGVQVLENTPVRKLLRDEKGRISGVDTVAGPIASDLVVVAAGSWSNYVTGFAVPIEPVKGQILMLEVASPPFRKVLRSERCYLVARLDGRVLVGATMERVGFDKAVSARSVGALLSAAREVAPSLANAFGGEAWAGLRPATPDGLPAIGLVEHGLISATGHFRNGILLAPVTAKIVADSVAGRPPHPAAKLLDPCRFATRP